MVHNNGQVLKLISLWLALPSLSLSLSISLSLSLCLAIVVLASLTVNRGGEAKGHPQLFSVINVWCDVRLRAHCGHRRVTDSADGDR